VDEAVELNASDPTLVGVLRDGGWVFVLVGFVARLPPAMLTLGVTLFAAQRLGGFGPAGTVVASMAVGLGVGGPVVGGLADRFGQRVVGIGTALLVTVALVGTVMTMAPERPLALPMAMAFLLGATNPQVTAMARGRWSAMGRLREDRGVFTSVAMSYEGVAEETTFVLGPVIVGLLQLVHPLAGLVVAGVLGLTLPVVFALLPNTLGPVGATTTHEHVRVPWLRLVPVGLSVAAVGMVFGSTSTGVAASLSAQGRPALAGIVYGGMGIGSAVSGVLTTRLPRSLAQRSRVVIFAAVLALVAPLVAIAPAPWWLMAACFLCGCGLAPVLIGSFAIAESVSPLARIGTVMTALGTCVVAGVALGSSLAGLLIDGNGPAAALLLPTAAGVAALLAAVMARAQRAMPLVST
jgi:MFS family permease